MKKSEREAREAERFSRMMEQEERLKKKGIRFIGGMDEVGRGPLAGPVVAACVVLPDDFYLPGVDDSKKLSEKKREALCEIILEKALSCGIGIVDNEQIDRINILEATREAMVLAYESARDQMEEPIQHLLIDALTLDRIPIPQTGIIKGDSTSISIASASIVAKVTRDRMMLDYHRQYPHYAFDRNKGYGTELHYIGLKEKGYCHIHRKTFIKQFLT